MDADGLITGIRSVVHALPWHWLVAGMHLALATLASLHAILFKRDPRAAWGWVSVCILFPLLGPLLYYMFGINRIQTRARKLAPVHLFRSQSGREEGLLQGEPGVDIGRGTDDHLNEMLMISDRVTHRSLTADNSVEILKNGEQAYPSMLDAIGGAVQRVSLITYLFESDSIGNAFADALISAHRRGVEVRVIVDGVGELYSWPRISGKLKRAGVRIARFLPPRLVPPAFFINLRNHRKILAVDGNLGFSGGMNIGARHMMQTMSPRRTADLHFRIQGPVVAQLEAVFAEDWHFVTGENPEFGGTPHEYPGNTLCRCISDGPNEDLDMISMVMMGMISVARRSITILTPYFLPSREMIASLQTAALRGVDVTVILPQHSNLRFIDWATRKLLWQLLKDHVHVYYQPPPFAHTKMFIVDGVYAQIGSANLDPRSLRLNFELNLEVAGTESVAPMADYARTIRQNSTEITLAEIDRRSLPVRIRDAACWLLTPYL